MNQMISRPWPILGLALALLLALPGAATAAKGGIPGPPPGESANNLSLPGLQTDSINTIAANWATPDGELLGDHYSYGCDQTEYNGQFSYPNTSCVDDLDAPSAYYSADDCVLPGNPCEGFLASELSRIYWQKVDVNEWWADDQGISPNLAVVAYVDWGDALEANTWTTKSKLRVETQPYSSTMAGFDPSVAACGTAATDPSTECKIGFQMWHVSGQGITEHWGVRATDDDDAVSYNYDSPFQIIKTGTARLNVTKMEPGDAECPQPGGGEEEGEVPILQADPPPQVGPWNGSGWDGTCTVRDADYSVETSVGGKYVYGYNLDMKATVLDPVDCAGWQKAGYWRLTFYTDGGVGGAVQFTDSLTPNVAPPAVPAEARGLPRTAFNTALAPPSGPPDDDRLYAPVVDTLNNLTYLDICIVLRDQGGGRE